MDSAGDQPLGRSRASSRRISSREQPPDAGHESGTRPRFKVLGGLTSKRRTPPAPSSEGTSAPSEEEAAGGNAGRKRKWRKATNTIRREEKEELQTEVQQLRTQLEKLKSRVFGLPTEAELASDRRCKARMVENRRLRRELQQHVLRLAPVHALLDECSLSVSWGCRSRRCLGITV
jgi:hypothetical protein